MPRKQASPLPEAYKTEEQLKAEAKARYEADSKRIANQPPNPAAQKRENFWYHYKWHTIGIILFVIFMSFLTRDLFFRTKPDATIIMISRENYTQESLDDLAQALESAAADFNGDKKVSVSIDSLFLPVGDAQQGDGTAAAINGQQEYASTIKLFSVIAAASDPIYLLDGDAYAYITGINGGESLFVSASIPAAGLAFGDARNAEAFSSMRFYLRGPALWEKNPAYYRYCEELLQSAAASSLHS